MTDLEARFALVRKALAALLLVLFTAQCAPTGQPPPPVTFRWPPPPWTSRYEIPIRLVGGGTETFGRVFHNLKSALDRAGILDWSAYMIEPTDGFVIVARMESINRDGRPLDGQNRWLSEGRPSFTSVFELLERLVTASTGRYRVIVLAYTGRTVVADPNEVPNSLPQLATQGPASLPPALAATPSPSAVACVALVYEFQKLPGRDPEWLDASRSGLTAKQHLVGAGLWKEAELYNE